MRRLRALNFLAILFVFSRPLAADERLPPHAATDSIKLPNGFKATLFAGEPDVVQPMSITFDDRGRMWVVECRSYPAWHPTDAKVGSDRILILEDVDGDGRFDQSKTFLDRGVNFSSVEFGLGGAYVMAIPNLLFVPDANRDDVPDGPARVVLDGFDLKSKHNAPNSLMWGPDGWLYGCNGILSNSRLGKPGTPDENRIPMNCGIWRFHPVSEKFEVVAHGTTNPWGLAFDERGEAFLTNCVIEHAFHVIPGARFKRMFGQDFNPKTFELMQTCADHIHWAGGTWEGSRNATGKHGEAGGGHAHSGAMIYLGDQFPDEFRNCLFTLNIHGQRLNRDRLERHGSGYVAKHLADFAPSGDPWFRGVCVKQGPDGSVYFTDWSDTGECHNYEDATIHRESGRIFKVKYGSDIWKPIDYSKLSDVQLIGKLKDRDSNRALFARRLLHERSFQGKLSEDSRRVLSEQFVSSISQSQFNLPLALQSLWTLHAVGELTKKHADLLLNVNHENDTIRGWLIRLQLESQISQALVNRLAELAGTDESAYVRLQIAAGLQRLPLDQRMKIAQSLVANEKDASDHNLPLMIWYGIEPLVASSDDDVVSLARVTKIPKLRQFIARHLASGDIPRFAALLRWLEESSDDPAATRDLLLGLHAGIEGRHDVKPNAAWMAVAARLGMSKDDVVRELTNRISLIQGSDSAFNYFVQAVRNQKLDQSARERAIADLVATRRPQVADLLLEQLSDNRLRSTAIRGLAGFDRAETGERLIKQYASLSDAEKLDAIATLTSRPRTAMELMAGVDAGQIPKLDLSEFDVRQLQRYKDGKLKELVQKHFGAKPTSAERAKQIAEMKKRVQEVDGSHASANRGRKIFQKNCATCHTLFGEGRLIGPDLTGAQRTDLDYVLINVMDPNALVGHAFRVTVLELNDGRVVNGIVKEEDAHTIALQTATDRIVIAIPDIESRQMQPVSMMPEGLLDRLAIEDVRDLVKYLASPSQVSAN